MRFLVYALLLSAFTALASAANGQGVPADAAIALQRGDYDAARNAMRAAGADPFDRRALDAIILQRQGAHAEAATAFRALLSERPDARHLRRALVASLRALDQHNSALFHADRLIQTAPDADARRRDRASRSAILSDRPYGASAGVSIIPSTNINRATETTSFTFNGIPLDVNETEVSGFGARGFVAAFRRFQLGESELRFDAVMGVTVFDDDRFNRADLRVSASHLKPLEAGFLRSRVFADRHLFRLSEDNNTVLGFGLQRRWLTSPRQYWDLHVTARATRYDDENQSRLDNQTLEIGTAMGRRLTDRSTLSAGVTLIGNRTNDARFSHQGARVSLGLAHSFRNGIRIDAGGFAERLWYEDEFAPFGMPRNDFGRGVSIGVQNNRLTILGAAPRVGCSASRRSSNIVFYDNRDVLECNLSLTHRF